MDRLKAQDYCREALAVLGESGPDALTIAVLCDRLDVTKGSFYHHFGSLSGFVDALLLFWEAEHSERLIALSRAQPDAGLRISMLIDAAVELPHEPESAIRAWGRSNRDVADVVVRVDRRRERHLTDSISALGIERSRARLFARMALNLLVGVQQREEVVDLRRLRQMFEELQRSIFFEADPKLVRRLWRYETG